MWWMGGKVNGRLITSLEYTNRNIMWPLTPKCLSTLGCHGCPACMERHAGRAAIRCTSLSALHTFRSLKKLLSVYFSFFHREGWAQRFSPRGGGEGDNRMRYHTAHSKLVPVLYLRWRSNHNHTRVWLWLHAGEQGFFIQVKIKVWLEIVLFDFIICFQLTGKQWL